MPIKQVVTRSVSPDQAPGVRLLDTRAAYDRCGIDPPPYRLTYGKSLKLKELLACQVLESAKAGRPAHDELLPRTAVSPGRAAGEGLLRSSEQRQHADCPLRGLEIRRVEFEASMERL